MGNAFVRGKYGLSRDDRSLHNGPECLERAWAGTAALSPPRVIALVEG
jgi:hypothetical protein